jgi:predicted flap endonuclease-1-like 5' DNA nuclease
VIIDDLKVVEGIGPQVEEVLQSAGVTNWTTLAKSTPAALRDILNAAGPEFNAHDPSTWPQQAVLAIGGHWHTLRSLQDSLRGGRA